MAGRVTLADWRKIVDTAVSRAKAGDDKARKWLSDYLMGPPVQRSEISGRDGEPIPIQITEVVVKLPDESVDSQ
jgi:hypothetical protein